MPDFKDLSSLFKHIEQKASTALKREVAKTVTHEMSDTIKEVTYNQYEPTQYERRMDNGGLSDERNYTVEIIDDNTISITNDTTGAGDDYGMPIDEVIVDGVGYSWTESNIYKKQPFPRDFYQDTVNRLNTSGKHIEALKTGLQRQGLDVRK